MKTTYAVLAVFAMSVAGSVHAGGGAYPEPYLWKGESTTTRAEVIAEMQLGMPSVGEEGFAAASNSSGKSRDQVVAELQEADHLGLLSIGEGDVKFATAEQEQLIADAGRRAAERVLVAKAAGI